MKSRYCTLVWASALCLALTVNASGSLPDGAYRLTDDASFVRGCFPPCLCPLRIGTDFRGTLNLARTGGEGTADVYAVTDVNWLVYFADAELRISGEGTYYRDEVTERTHRLVLTLKIGDEDPVQFDSGVLLLRPFSTPGFDITIAMNKMYCFDTVIRVAAAPVPATELLPYTLGRTSEYQEGCWPPCLCPILVPVPATGTFALVPLRHDPLFAEYAVVKVNWRVGTSPVPMRVTGGGFYRVGGEVAVLQQLRLWLSFDGAAPIAFDSGLVDGGAGFPRIDITIARNHFYCYDQVFYLHARPLSIVPLTR